MKRLHANHADACVLGRSNRSSIVTGMPRHTPAHHLCSLHSSPLFIHRALASRSVQAGDHILMAILTTPQRTCASCSCHSELQSSHVVTFVCVCLSSSSQLWCSIIALQTVKSSFCIPRVQRWCTTLTTSSCIPFPTTREIFQSITHTCLCALPAYRCSSTPWLRSPTRTVILTGCASETRFSLMRVQPPSHRCALSEARLV